MKIIKNISLILLIIFSSTFAQNISKNHSDVFVDSSGVMRWKGTNEEVSLFGVNYTTPFAYSYRAHKKLGISLKDAIDLDVAQMVRLGFDGFRVHVWDKEISDENGNLLSNEHLDLFDYLLYKLSENGIKIIVTPIAWWGNGWPEPDMDVLGFAKKYSKVEIVTNPEARTAQKNYLAQFINHFNPYSKGVYKNDASIIAVEIFNEPNHPDDNNLAEAYINEMHDVLRSAGFTKPIFYNISENPRGTKTEAVLNSKAEGISFQWYPTSLVHNKKLVGDFLINVNKYSVPFADKNGYGKKAKMIYEFDAADIGGSYIYPAMIRSFREAGMQFAAMFCYDPAQIAWSNTEYPTHFLNLFYTPSKAISLMIAAKAFHKIPRYKNYGNFPAGNSFDQFRVSYEEDLSEMNSEREFYYSNSTNAVPVNADKLGHIAGCGSSPVIKYNGTGAYFLDKIEDGLWMLEVNPDVIWNCDPFEKTSLSREAARLFWNESTMQINLPSIKENFFFSAVDKNNERTIQNAAGSEIKIKPGKYLVSNKKPPKELIEKYAAKFKNDVSIFVPQKENNEIVVNKTKPEVCEGEKVKFAFTIASENDLKSAGLFIRRIGWNGFEKHQLVKTGKYFYEAGVNSPALKNGIVEYCVTIDNGKEKISFPSGQKENPNDWDFIPKEFWKLKINPPEILVLYEPLRDQKDLLFPNYSPAMRYSVDYIHSSSAETMLKCEVKFSGNESACFSFMNNVSKYIYDDTALIRNYKTLMIRGCSVEQKDLEVRINLLFTDGSCIGKKITLDKQSNETEISLNSFVNSEREILPHSYPSFMPKIWKDAGSAKQQQPDLSKLDFIQFTIDKPANANIENDAVGFELGTVYLKK